MAELESLNITEEFYEEFTEKAVWTRSDALQKLTTLWGAAAEREAEAKRVAEEAADDVGRLVAALLSGDL